MSIVTAMPPMSTAVTAMPTGVILSRLPAPTPVWKRTLAASSTGRTPLIEELHGQNTDENEKCMI